MTGLKLDRTEWAVQDISAHVEPELSLGLGAAMNRSRDLPCNLVGRHPLGGADRGLQTARLMPEVRYSALIGSRLF